MLQWQRLMGNVFVTGSLYYQGKMTRCSSKKGGCDSAVNLGCVRLFPFSEHVACVHVRVVFFLQCKLIKLSSFLQTRKIVSFLTPLIASSECKSEAIKVMLELCCKITEAWIASEECISSYF